MKHIVRHITDTLYDTVCLFGCLLTGESVKEVLGNDKNQFQNR